MIVYYKMGVVGMLAMCGAIPGFFIFSTDISGNFKITEVSWICLLTGIISAILMAPSYIRANQLIREQQNLNDALGEQ